ncbi:MAG TPA: glycosyltransferase, partial [Ignavibacteriales bacterium]|nr:glycosyltransferase [Ignavibacteriales bacterium]
MKEPVIGQIKCPYLPPTQTFIHEFISHLEPELNPLFTNKIINLKSFPYGNINYFKNLFMLESRLKEFGVCGLHAHFGHNGTFLLPLKMKLGLPMLTSFHGADVSSRPKEDSVYRKNLQELFKQGELFTVVSEAMAQRVIRLGCPPEKIRVLHCGIDLKRISYRPPANVPYQQATILSVGRLVEKKGMADLLEAMARVKALRPKLSCRLLIVGEGPLERPLKQLSNKLGLAQEVSFLGVMSRTEIIRLLAEAQLFVLASRQASNGDAEGIPVALMEALAGGLPVITSNHEGIPELVRNRQNGLVVPEG